MVKFHVAELGLDIYDDSDDVTFEQLYLSADLGTFLNFWTQTQVPDKCSLTLRQYSWYFDLIRKRTNNIMHAMKIY